MSSKKQSLGRGLDALLMGAGLPATGASGATGTTGAVGGSDASSSSDAASRAGMSNTSSISGTSGTSGTNNNLTVNGDSFPSADLLELALNCIQPGPYQPRLHFHEEELQSLADSIRAQGILQPIVVRPLSSKQNQNKNEIKYEIIAGERRFRAAKIAGLEKIPVVIKDVEKEAAMAMALIENIQRQDLNPLEEAMALDKLTKELKWTHIQVAEAIGKSRVSVTNSLRLLSLCDEVKTMLDKGQIETGHAKVLLGLRGNEQISAAKSIVAKGLSVREAERLVAEFLSHDETDKMPKRIFTNPDVRKLQQNLSEKLGAKLEIQHGAQGKGKIVIQYNSLEELDGILDHFK